MQSKKILLCLIQNRCDSKTELISFTLFQAKFRILSIDYAEKIPYSALGQINIQGVILPLWQLVDMPGIQKILLGIWPEAETE